MITDDGMRAFVEKAVAEGYGRVIAVISGEWRRLSSVVPRHSAIDWTKALERFTYGTGKRP